MSVRKKLTLVAVCTLAILAGLSYAYNNNQTSTNKSSKISAIKYNEERISRLQKAEIGLTPTKVKKIVLDDYLYSQMAKDNGIVVTNVEVATAISAVGGSRSVAEKEYLTLVWHRNILQEKLQNSFEGYIRGRFVLARYDYRRVIENADPSPQNAKLTSEQLAKLSIEDEVYAKAMADRIHRDLMSKRINFDQAIQQELSDAKTGKTLTPTADHSGSFDTADKRSANYQLVNQPQVLKVLNKIPVGGISDVIKGQTVASFDMNKYADGVYLILTVDERASKITKYKSFSEMESVYMTKLERTGATL